MPETAPDPASPQTAPVVSPVLPCVLAWVLPGLGHLSLGRKGRAVAFFTVVLATFALGLFSGGTSSLADPQQPYVGELAFAHSQALAGTSQPAHDTGISD